MSSNLTTESVEEIIRQLLQKAREKCGISQEALATQLGKSQSYVAKVEGGTKRIDVIEMLKWCAALGVSVNELTETLATIYGAMILPSLWQTNLDENNHHD